MHNVKARKVYLYSPIIKTKKLETVTPGIYFSASGSSCNDKGVASVSDYFAR